MTKFRSHIASTILLLSLAAGAGAQNRLETPLPDIQQGLRDHENMIAVQLDRLRMEREFQQQKEAEFNALDPAAKKAAVDADFAAAWEKTSEWKLHSTDEFLPAALSKFRLEFNGSKAVVKNAQEKVIARVAKGDLLPVEHPDVSSYFLEVTDVDAAQKTLKVSIGDVVYTLHEDGKVGAPTAEELRSQLREKLSAYNTADIAQSYVPTTSTVSLIEALLKGRTKEQLRVSHLISEKAIEYRVTARPFEFALTMFCIAHGEDGGRGIVWEKGDTGYYVRPFPIGERIFDHVLPKVEIKSIAADSSSAVLTIGDSEITTELMGFIQIPLGGKTYIDAIAEHVSAQWHEVVIDAGGSRLVVAMLPPDLAAKPITGKTRDQIRMRMICNYLTHLADVKITPGSIIMETSEFVADNKPFGEVWNTLLGQHEWRYRWVGEKEILLDYPEYLGAAEIEQKRGAMR